MRRLVENGASGVHNVDELGERRDARCWPRSAERDRANNARLIAVKWVGAILRQHSRPIPSLGDHLSSELLFVIAAG